MFVVMIFKNIMRRVICCNVRSPGSGFQPIAKRWLFGVLSNECKVAFAKFITRWFQFANEKKFVTFLSRSDKLRMFRNMFAPSSSAASALNNVTKFSTAIPSCAITARAAVKYDVASDVC